MAQSLWRLLALCACLQSGGAEPAWMGDSEQSEWGALLPGTELPRTVYPGRPGAASVAGAQAAFELLGAPAGPQEAEPEGDAFLWEVVVPGEVEELHLQEPQSGTPQPPAEEDGATSSSTCSRPAAST